jgi:hypothetical protein
MGLDATVYCNCFERARLKEPPPCPTLVSISADGSLCCHSEDLNTQLSFDQWLLHRACEHANGVLLSHHVGNLAQVGLLRSELEGQEHLFPIVLAKILYSGTHAGDYLSLEGVRNLQNELEHLASFVCSREKNQESVDWFRQQMKELAEAALHVSKPISF